MSATSGVGSETPREVMASPLHLSFQLDCLLALDPIQFDLEELREVLAETFDQHGLLGCRKLNSTEQFATMTACSSRSRRQNSARAPGLFLFGQIAVKRGH